MKNAAVLLAIIASSTFTLIHSFADTPSDNPDSELSEYYRFQGCFLWAKHKTETFPVVAAHKKGLVIDSGRGLKRVPYTSASGYKQRLLLARNLVKVENVEFDFNYIADGTFRNEAIRQMNSMDFESDIQTSLATIGQRTVGTSEQVQQIETDRREFENEMLNVLEEGENGMVGLANSVDLTATLNPKFDIENAFCALVMSFIKDDPKSELPQKKATALRVRKLGNLQAGIPNKVSFTVDLSLGSYKPENCEIFLYSGDSTPLPTSVSKFLKRMKTKDLPPKP